MDVQSLLCGFGSDSLRINHLELPKLRRLQELRRRKFRKSTSSSRKNGPKNSKNGKRRVGRRHLPMGRGKYTVGCVDIMSDYSLKGIFMRLYYPTDSKDVIKREVQWPLWLPRKQYGHGYVYFRRMTKVFGTLLNWVGGDVYVPVLWQAPIIDGPDSYPVIIISHGLGGNRTTYSTLCTDLASHGFIVAAVEHRDGSASMTYTFKEPSGDNRPVTLIEYTTDSEGSSSTPSTPSGDDCDPPIISLPPNLHHQHTSCQEEWLRYNRQEKEDDYEIRNKQVYLRADEMKRTLDLLEAINAGKEIQNVLGLRFDLRQLKGCMDLNRVSVVGHSFGGATTIATLATDKRFKCGVGLDTWMLPLDDHIYNNVDRPLLLVNTETFQWPKNVRDMYKLKLNDANKTDRLLLTIRGTCHQSLSDFQFVVPSRLARLMEMRHTLSPKIALETNSDATLGFLFKHLDIPDEDGHDDILTGQHHLVIKGTNLDLDL